MEVQNIRIDLISPSPLNPRKTFDEAALEELASNIEKQGLLQPITVRVAKSEEMTNLETGDVTPLPYTYEIVCGERRFRAVSLLKAKEDEANVAKIKAHRKKSEKFQTISCIVREMTDDEAFEAMITENQFVLAVAGDDHDQMRRVEQGDGRDAHDCGRTPRGEHAAGVEPCVQRVARHAEQAEQHESGPRVPASADVAFAESPCRPRAQEDRAVHAQGASP